MRRNREIRVPEVRVIDEHGEQIGVLPTRDALERALAVGLELVEISPTAKPPVCRIMDYGKYLFEEGKKQAAAKKKQRQIKVKEIKIRPTTDEGDYKVKLNQLRNFLQSGDKVKITVRFRGREMAHQELGRRLLDRMQQDLSEIGEVEQHPKVEARQMIMVIGPRRGASVKVVKQSESKPSEAKNPERPSSNANGE